MKRFVAVAGVLDVAVLGLAACAPTKQPPPTTPRDVLVVGDSIGYSFGCVLGDDGGAGGSCPAPGGFTTKSAITGGCNISGGTILLYNSITTSSYACSDWPSSWSGLANQYTPRVVLIVTSGWEIMDRLANYPDGCDPNDAHTCSPPDRQWGGADPSAAANGYTANLQAAIELFRSHGSKVVVANSVYLNPPEPEFPPGTPGAPDFLINAWYERYPLANTAPPPVWQAPVNGLSYRPSKPKVEQFNQTISAAVSGLGDSNVSVFNFFKHFDPTAANPAYSDYVCPPPHDSDLAPSNMLDWHDSVQTNTPGAMAQQCDNGSGLPNGPTNPWNYAILARDPDGGHLSATPSGQSGQDILSAYLVPCVEGLLGVSGGDAAKCS